MRTRMSRWAILSPWLLAASLLLGSASVQAQWSDCVPGPGFECDTNRNGSDYNGFDLPQANAQMCQAYCSADNSCRAWTYVRPGVQGPNARCYLKNPAPAASANNCCISGTVSRIIDQQVAFEIDTNRHGSDYDRVEMAVANPDQCFERCRGDARCAAWTFVRPGVQGPNAVCYLKNPAPPPSPNNCCVSGAIAGGGAMPPVTPPPPPPPPPGVCDWATSNTFVEQHEGGAQAWRGVYTRRGGNVFDAVYARPGENGVDVLTLDLVAPNFVHVKRNNYSSVLVSAIGADGVARGQYDGGTRFTLTCGGQ
jgi:hypothetical protein